MTQLVSTHLCIFSTVALLLSLPGSCEGQFQVIGPAQPVEASVGDNVILPCHLEPASDASTIVFEWTRPDLKPRFVHVWRSGEDLLDLQHRSFNGRTSLSKENLKSGDISLRLSKVKPSDEGKYRCFVLGWKKEAFAELVVSAVSTSLRVTFHKVDNSVVLNCVSKGWYPAPKISWWDVTGNLLSAGLTNTVRGPDGLYTVSSRVTVEKRHSNSFTCRVTQKETKQTREAEIQVPDHIFTTQYSSGTVIGLAVALALSLLFCLCCCCCNCQSGSHSQTNPTEPDRGVYDEVTLN